MKSTKPQPPMNFSERFAQRWIALRWPLLAAAAVLWVFAALPAQRLGLEHWIGSSAAALFPAERLSFDRSIENMFAPDNPLLPPYRRLKERFGGNEGVLAVYDDPGLFSPEGLVRMKKLSGELAAVPGVAGVLSLAELDQMIKVAQLGLGSGILSEQANGYRKLMQGYTHGADGRTGSVFCLLLPEKESPVGRRETIAALRNIMRSAPGNSGKLAGEPVMVVDGFDYVEQDGVWLGWASTILLGLTIVLCFRSLRWVVIPIAVVRFTVYLTQAVLVWSGLQLSMVSSMLTAIVTVIGVATVVHITVRYRQQRMEGAQPQAALQTSLAWLIAPIFFACATDAVGFAALWTSHVGPVADFGTMMFAGSFVTLLSIFLLVPGLVLWGRFDSLPKSAWGEDQLGGVLAKFIHGAERRPRVWLAGLAVLFVFAVWGMTKLEVETDFTKNFRADSSIAQSYDFVETRLGGAGVWDIIVPAPSPLNEEYLGRVRELEAKLRKLPRVTHVVSLADLEYQAQQWPPLSAVGTTNMRLAAIRTAMPEFAAGMWSPETETAGAVLRIMLRSPERQTAQQKQELIDAAEKLAAEYFPPQAQQPQAEVTGYFVLLADLIGSMVRDQNVCFLVATIGVALMLCLAARSIRLGLIAVVPNALPILAVMGTLGWCGLKMNMGAAMIAAVSMGLSVDSSIHYLFGYRRARTAGQSVAQSLHLVQQQVGRAASISTLALVVGFSVLCISNFVPTIYFGLLVSLSMFGGLLGNLIVLPLLIRLTER